MWPDVSEVIDARRLIVAYGLTGYIAVRGEAPEVLLDAIDEMAMAEAWLDHRTRRAEAARERRRMNARTK